MRVFWIVLAAICAIGAHAQATTPAWADSFETGGIASYLQGPVAKGVSLEKAGQDGGVALRLAPGIRTEARLKEFAIEPGVKYWITFSARLIGPDAIGKNPATEKLLFEPNKAANGLLLPGWEIRVLNARGQLPFEGHSKSFWQYCMQGDWAGYRQSFYTPADGQTLQVIFVNPGGQNTLVVDDVKLEKSTEDNLLIGGETFSGLFDYSGWSELSKARIIEKDGKFLLRIEQNGYALTDPIPVQPGATYLLSGKKPNAGGLFYDADMHRIGFTNWAGSKFTAPAGCAYVQLYFGPGDIEGVAVKLAPEVKK